uniref:uncharacterized protein LOC106995676 isoform X2 n=1 Tax=Macaca mulatta TaxID=9544 RepID=UPI0010A26F40|nr:uncharacterized protein LOC106995676 isoform X2 [Macaca mulatta]
MSPEEWPFTSWLHAEAPGAPLRVAVQGKVAASAVSAPLEGAEARVLQEPPAEAQGLLAVRADAALRARPGGSGRPGSHGQDDHEPLNSPAVAIACQTLSPESTLAFSGAACGRRGGAPGQPQHGAGAHLPVRRGRRGRAAQRTAATCGYQSGLTR